MSAKGKERVYSYTRFSSKEQMKGDSKRRQTEAIEAAIEAARKHAKNKGMVLDESLKMIDEGFSGYHGKHRSKGAFGQFLKKVEAGEVPRGSILLVENLDRLSREPVLTAMSTISGLLTNGITIETLSPPDTFTKDNVNNGAVWKLLAHIERAHSESKRKSDLAKANWMQKRAIASKERMLTARAPAWFKIVVKKENSRVVGREVSVIPDAAATIRKIFELKLAGFGKFAIERKLNSMGCWHPGNGWRASYIEKILKNRAVIGEHQSHKLVDGKRVPVDEPKAGYFDAIVDEDTFNAVQKRTAEHTNKGGRTGKVRNVLRNLCVCGYCGGPVTFVNKGSPPKGGQYLVCENGRSGKKCAANPVSYFETEQLILDNCSKLRPELILPNASEQANEVKRLRLRLESLDVELSNLERKIETYVDQVGETPERAMRQRYEQRITELETKKAGIRTERKKAEGALHDMEHGLACFAEFEKNLATLKKAIAKDTDARVKLNAHLKEFIVKIEVFAKGHDSNVERAEDIMYEHAPRELLESPGWRQFLKYLRQRLLSSNGRFLKIWFKTVQRKPAGVPLAPAESLAYQVEVRAKEFKVSGPDINRVFNEFFDGRKQGFVPKSSALNGHTRDCSLGRPAPANP